MRCPLAWPSTAEYRTMKLKQCVALLTTRDHLFGEVIIEDTDAAATRTTQRVAGTAIWTDGSRLEDGPVGMRSRTIPPLGHECGSTWARTKRSTTRH